MVSPSTNIGRHITTSFPIRRHLRSSISNMRR
jgi:hypothetical protein